MSRKITLENLGGMIKRGFDEMGEQIGGVKKEVDSVKKEVDSVKKEVDSVKKEVDGVKRELRILSENNTREHEEIKLRLDNVAYRFEVVALEKRVDKLERIVLSRK